MAMWQFISSHLRHQVLPFTHMYTDQFSVEVRTHCAAWIEERNIVEQDYDINDPTIEQRANNFVIGLITELQLKIASYQRPEDISTRLRLENAAKMLQEWHECNNAFAIYKHIRDTLQMEWQLIANYNSNGFFDDIPSDDKAAREIERKLGELDEITQTATRHYDAFDRTAECYSAYVCRSTEMRDLQILQMQENVKEYLMVFGQIFAEIAAKIDDVQNQVIYDRLARWQQNQKFSGDDFPLAERLLSDIQKWFERIFWFSWSTRNLIIKIRATHVKHNVNFVTLSDDSLKDHHIKVKLQELIASGFVVEKQPPQVLKTKTKYIVYS